MTPKVMKTHECLSENRTSHTRPTLTTLEECVIQPRQLVYFRKFIILLCWSVSLILSVEHLKRLQKASFLLIIHVTLGGIETQIECSAPLNPSLHGSPIIHVYGRPSELLIWRDNENMLIIIVLL